MFQVREVGFLAALACGLSAGSAEADDPMRQPKSAILHQIELLREGKADELKSCFTDRLRSKVTAELVEQGQKQIAAIADADLVDRLVEKTVGGRKVVDVMMKASGRRLTTLVNRNGKWLADTVWFGGVVNIQTAVPTPQPAPSEKPAPSTPTQPSAKAMPKGADAADAETHERLIARFDRIAEALKDVNGLGTDVSKQMDNLRLMVAAKEQLADAKKRFPDQLDTNTGSKLDLTYGHAKRTLMFYERATDDVVSAQSAKQSVDQALTSAKIAVDNKSAVMFLPGGSPAMHLERARAIVQAMELLKRPDTEIAKKQVEDAAQTIEEMKKLVPQPTIAQNQPPPDEYRGADREELLKRIRDMWAKEGTGQEVLKIGIVTAQWTRKWRLEKLGSSWTESDDSRIQGYVIVKRDDKVAVRHSINFNKDHRAGDRVTASFLDDPKAEPPFAALLSIAKLN